MRNYIYQPNRVTNASYNYTLLQEKIFNCVMFYLQAHIKQVMSGCEIYQLELFKERNNEDITVYIPISFIGKPTQYTEIRNAAKELISVIVSMRNPQKKTVKFSGLFSSVEMPEAGKRSSYLTITVHRDVAELLVYIEKNERGAPKNYTTFLFEVANNAKNKYTSRLYKYISSWKEKGGFYITIDELREWLQLDGIYTDYNDIKRRILMPVMEELKEKADVWFNCAVPEFEKKDGKKIIGLNFKVIAPDLIEIQEKLRNSIHYLLRTHFKLNNEQLDSIHHLLDGSVDFQEIQYKIVELNDRIRSSDIGNVQAYVIKALLNMKK